MENHAKFVEYNVLGSVLVHPTRVTTHLQSYREFVDFRQIIAAALIVGGSVTD